VDRFQRANATGLPQERRMNIIKNLGMLLLAIYLILIGISSSTLPSRQS
jgi:hypothetical protein